MASKAEASTAISTGAGLPGEAIGIVQIGIRESGANHRKPSQFCQGCVADFLPACEASISGHAAKVEADIAEAMKRHRIRAPWTAESLALHTQAVLQGAFILAKAKGGAAVAIESVSHLHRYIELLFHPPKRKRKEML